jgi:5'-nucleotidase
VSYKKRREPLFLCLKESESIVSEKALEPVMVVAISSRALFDLSDSHEVYERDGVEAYCRYQIEHEDDVLAPGVAFSMVKKLLSLNSDKKTLVEVILLSRNSADTGLRIFNSIQAHQLNIMRAAFTGGRSPYAYASEFGAHLFLSADSDDVDQALASKMAAATIVAGSTGNSTQSQLCIAFDGDAVLFSDEAEKIYQKEGLEAFTAHEIKAAKTPLSDGPFKGFLAALHLLQSAAESNAIRTALVTARAAPAHERVIRTLRAWNIRIDEALFLGGRDKGAFLKSLGADIFFDDQHKHCQSASEHVATGHVPHGITNQLK